MFRRHVGAVAYALADGCFMHHLRGNGREEGYSDLVFEWKIGVLGAIVAPCSCPHGNHFMTGAMDNIPRPQRNTPPPAYGKGNLPTSIAVPQATEMGPPPRYTSQKAKGFRAFSRTRIVVGECDNTGEQVASTSVNMTSA